MTEEVDAWETESGLPGDFDAEVTDAAFILDERFDRVQLELALKTDDPDIGDSGTYTLRVGVGEAKKWQIIGRGDRVEHASGRLRRFNVQSGYGVFLSRAVELAGDVLRSRGTPHTAGIWVGTKWHFDREAYTMKDRDTGENMTRDRLVPVQYLGARGEAAPPATGGAAAVVAEVDEAVLRLARQVREEGGTVDTFIERVYEAGLQVDMDRVDEMFAVAG